MNATLTDDRIETMRSTVMNTVDGDIKRRGTRTRRAIGLGAASVLVVGFGAFGLSSLNGNGGNDSVASTGSQDSALTSEPNAGDEAGGAVADQAAPTDLKATNREVITTGSINVTVSEPRESAQKVSAYVDSVGGRVDSRSESGDGDFENAILEARVPSSKVTETIAKLKTYGDVNDVTLQNSDVTAQAQDLDARIEALSVSIKRLEKIVADSTSSDELIKAEGALTERQEQLESLAAQRASVKDQVQLSTLTIELTQKVKADGVEPNGFKGGVIDGWNALVSTLNNIVELVGIILPWSAVALVFYGAYRLVARQRRRQMAHDRSK